MAAVVAVVAASPPSGASAAAPDLSAYRGAGAWVDIYDPALLRAPERTVARITANGARTLYLETANYRQPTGVDIVHRRATARMVDAAHARGIRVVAWYLPSFADPVRDLRRSLAAVEFNTGRGNRFDSFALDIEANVIASITRRNRALHTLSRRIRRAVGPDYPLGAIVPDSRSTAPLRSLWPLFPYSAVAPYYDVLLPMAYSTFRVRGGRAAYRYTRQNLEHIQWQLGPWSRPVHLIGGLADDLDAGEGRAVVRAARHGGAIGASFYKVSLSGREDWQALGWLP